MEIDKLEGRELNTRVALALGWKLAPSVGWLNPNGEIEERPDWANDIAAAWGLAEMASYFSVERTQRRIPCWSCEYALPGKYIQEATADTASLAISRAYLKVMEAPDATA